MGMEGKVTTTAAIQFVRATISPSHPSLPRLSRNQDLKLPHAYGWRPDVVGVAAQR